MKRRSDRPTVRRCYRQGGLRSWFATRLVVVETFYARYGKRVFDLALAIPGMIVISPVLLITALLVRVKLGSPVLFRQVRPGLHGRPFTIHKFRTMTDARDADGNLLPDGERLTRFGRFCGRAVWMSCRNYGT